MMSIESSTQRSFRHSLFGLLWGAENLRPVGEIVFLPGQQCRMAIRNDCQTSRLANGHKKSKPELVYFIKCGCKQQLALATEQVYHSRPLGIAGFSTSKVRVGRPWRLRFIVDFDIDDMGADKFFLKHQTERSVYFSFIVSGIAQK